MIKSRIKEHALARGQEIKFARNLEELTLFQKEVGIKRLIIDLSAGAEFASSFTTILNPKIESIGVIAHVDLDTQAAAEAAGFSEVIPRSLLVKNLEQIMGS